MTPDAEFPLTIGRTYVVYACTVFDGYSWSYVLDDDGHHYPVWYPAVLFSVADPQIPPDWVFGYVRPRPDEDGYPLISSPSGRSTGSSMSGSWTETRRPNASSRNAAARPNTTTRGESGSPRVLLA